MMLHLIHEKNKGGFTMGANVKKTFEPEQQMEICKEKLAALHHFLTAGGDLNFYL